MWFFCYEIFILFSLSFCLTTIFTSLKFEILQFIWDRVGSQLVKFKFLTNFHYLISFLFFV